MTRDLKPSVCPCCKQIRLRREYCTKKDGSPYQNCRFCGNGKHKPFEMRECVTCGESKRLTKEFVALKSKDGKNAGYTVDCRECREKNNVRSQMLAEAARARKIVKREKVQEVCAEPVRVVKHSWENLGLEWSGRKVYDPYANANRYEGART